MEGTGRARAVSVHGCGAGAALGRDVRGRGDRPHIGERGGCSRETQGWVRSLTPHSPRLVELAPQYYLSNLPPSESRDLLMELREKLVATEDTPALPEPLGEAAGGEDEEREVCVLQ